jgi:general secretion pathway protein C
MMLDQRGLDATTTVNTIDHSAWKARFEDTSNRIQDRVRDLWRRFARDSARLQRLQTGLIVLLVMWSLSSVSQLIWIPFRANPIDAAPALALNPPKPAGGQQTTVIDASGVQGLGLFGGSPEAFADADSATLIEASRDGIEQNAQETRLALTLTGIVASTEDGIGSAVIKSGATEKVYGVGDALPASGQVVLAKVMPQQVVIDNNGTYELMKLYEGPGIAIPTRTARAPRQDAVASPPSSNPNEASPSATAAQQTALASQYRRQLYDSPESLASVVSVSPVREGDRVIGYRLAPGADRVAFDTFGFQSGDIVTAVNGLALSNASNTVKLYQTMKDATRASFDIERDGGTVTLNVDLASP